MPPTAATAAHAHAPAPRPPAGADADADEVPAIRVQGVSKHYHLWKSPSVRLNYSFLSQLHRTLRTFMDRDAPALAAIARRRAALGEDFFALRDVSFSIRRGESVGLIGRNGSGKSTLLQVVVNTLRPTAGEVDVEGRIAAMLELGSGFNPEFTGRENARLNALILGLEPEEVNERMDAIVDFAELGVFIDQPVKNYSSGMVVRLGFAVLTQIEPEILIIDEALAVGDFLFQQKCFDTIRRFKARGCTLLFVSHTMTTVLELCDRAILLDSGRIAFDGPARDAVNLYEATALRSRLQTGGRPLEIVGAPDAASTAPVAPAPVNPAPSPAKAPLSGRAARRAKKAAAVAAAANLPAAANPPAAAPAPLGAAFPPPTILLPPAAAKEPPSTVPPATPAAAPIPASPPRRPLPPSPPPTWERMAAAPAGRLVPVLPDHAPGANGFAPEKLRRLASEPARSGAAASPAETEVGSMTSPDVALQFVRVIGQDGVERDWITSEEEMTLDIGILCHRALDDPHVGFKIRDRLGRVIFETSTLGMREPAGPLGAGEVLVTRFRFFLPIHFGEYSITVGFANGGVGEEDFAEPLLFVHGVKIFHVYKNAASILWSGVCNLFPQVAFSRAGRGLFVMDPLPEDQAARVEWRLLECPAEARAGQEFTVEAALANRSEHAIHSRAPHPVNFCYHWRAGRGKEVVVADGLRTPLPGTLAAGAADVAAEARVLAPAAPGEYLLELTLVQEGVRWFESVRPDLLQGRRVRIVRA